MNIIIHADKDELNFPHSPEVEEALKGFSIESIKRYQKEPELLEILSKKHNIPKEQIFLEAGGIGIIHRVFDSTICKKSKVLLPLLGYPYYHKLAQHHKAKINTFGFIKNKNSFYYNIKDIIKKLKTNTKILVLIDPESPLGFSITEKDLIKILKNTNKNTLVMLDQEHEGFRENNIKDTSKLISQFPNLLIIRGFSKFYGFAGLRIAYALCGKNIKSMINFKERYLGFNCLSQQLAIAALNSEKHYKENAEKIKKEKLRFNKSINKIKNYSAYETDNISSIVEVPEKQTNFIIKQAKELGILIRYLGDYHNPLKNLFRITMCSEEEIDRIIDLFSSVAWLYDLNTYNSKAKSIINTRSSGYTVHRKEIPCEKSKLLMGLHKVIIPPGKNVPLHHHSEQDELFEFHSSALFELNGERINIKPGNWVNVKPNDSHYIGAPKERFARFIPLRFPYIHKDKFSPSGNQLIHEK